MFFFDERLDAYEAASGDGFHGDVSLCGPLELRASLLDE
jgi:hypothetical protein